MGKEAISITVVYRNLIARIKDLIITPRREWKVILNENNSINEVFVQYSLPLLVIYAVSVFFGQLFGVHDLHLGNAIVKASFVFSAYLFSLYIGYLILFNLKIISQLSIDKATAFKLVAFPSGVIYIVGAITELFPEMLVFGSLVYLYVIYIVWIAVEKSRKEDRLLQVVLISIVVFLMPYLILNKLLIPLSDFIV